MKANELMIGDWVYYKGKEQMPCRVISIGGNSIKFDNGTPQDWMSDAKNFTPIPLTAEILEKNGFSHIMYSDAYYSIMIDDTYVELRKYKNMAVWFNWKENNDGVYADYILPMPEFVHELQHALRLCNIDKEIEL